MKLLKETIVVGLAAFVALLGAAFAQDSLFQAHAWVLFFVLVVSTILLLRKIRTVAIGDTSEDTDGYFDGPTRYGAVATVFWGIVGFLVGVVIAAQLAYPELNIEPWFNFGRLRPLHTSAVIFAFGGNALICTSFYIVQRTSRARLFGGNLGWFVFWGYQLFIVLAATGYLLGVTQSKEYAEPEWYVDLWLTVVWVAYLIVFVGTIVKRKEPHIYVANWFLLSFIITVAMLHRGQQPGHAGVAARRPKATPVFAGVQDALTQWWYGHNAVGFFLTAGFLGMMYYFVPKQAETPGLFLPPVDRSLLVADLPVHLGRPASPALHRAAGLGPDPRHGVLGDAVDAVLGRHDQRPDDAVGRLGQAAHRPGPAHDGDLGRLLRHVHVRRAR